MALIGDTNFSMKPNVDMASIASLFQKKAADEQTMKAQQSQIESQQQDRITGVMKMATDMTQNLIVNSQRNLMQASAGHVADALGMMTATPSAETKPAASSLFPGMTSAPTGSTQTPFTQTPEGQQYVQQQLIKGNPAEYSKQAIDAQFKKPSAPDLKPMLRPDGSIGYVRIDSATGKSAEVPGVNAPPSAFNAPPVQLSDTDRQPGSVIDAQARMLTSGKANPSTIANLRTQVGQKIVARALEIDPSWDSSVPAQRTQMRKDYTSNGAAGKSLIAFNTALAHSDVVDKALDKLDNSAFPDWNKVANKVSVKVGDPRLGTFKVARNLFADEMAKAAQGGTGIITEDERARQLESFDSSASPQQMRAAVDTAIQLMASKSKVLKDNWENSMPGVKPALPFVTSQAAKVLKSRGYSPNTLEQEASPSENPGMDLSKFWK